MNRIDSILGENNWILHKLHETFMRLAATGFSSMLDVKVKVNQLALSSSTIGKFQQQSGMVVRVKLRQKSGPEPEFLIVIPNEMLVFFYDRLLGARTNDALPEELQAGYKLSGCEKNVSHDIVERMLGNLRESWYVSTDILPEIITMETVFPEMPSNIEILQTSIDVRTGEHIFTCHIFYPEPAITMLLYPVPDSVPKDRSRPGEWDKEPADLFYFAQSPGPESLNHALTGERPRTVAFVLSFFPADTILKTLLMMERQRRDAIMNLLGIQARTSKETAHKIEQVVKDRLMMVSQN